MKNTVSAFLISATVLVTTSAFAASTLTTAGGQPVGTTGGSTVAVSVPGGEVVKPAVAPIKSTKKVKHKAKAKKKSVPAAEMTPAQ